MTRVFNKFIPSDSKIASCEKEASSEIPTTSGRCKDSEVDTPLSALDSKSTVAQQSKFRSLSSSPEWSPTRSRLSLGPDPATDDQGASNADVFEGTCTSRKHSKSSFDEMPGTMELSSSKDLGAAVSVRSNEDMKSDDDDGVAGNKPAGYRQIIDPSVGLAKACADDSTLGGFPQRAPSSGSDETEKEQSESLRQILHEHSAFAAINVNAIAQGSLAPADLTVAEQNWRFTIGLILKRNADMQSPFPVD